MSLQFKLINNPHDFVEIVQTDQNDYLYVYTDDIFIPTHDIEPIIISAYEEYKSSMLFTDISMISDNIETYQYFNDIANRPPTVIYSPVIVRYLPIQLEVYDNIQYHCFSFIKQIMQHVLPWHIPSVGFQAKINNEQFKRISKDCIWVMQYGT